MILTRHSAQIPFRGTSDTRGTLTALVTQKIGDYYESQYFH